MKITKNNDQSGSALIFTILILFILSILGSVLISVAMTNFKITNNSNDYNAAYYLADGAAEKMVASLEAIAYNAAYLAKNEINYNSSDYIKEDDSYELTGPIEDDAFNYFVSFLKEGSSENDIDGLEEIESSDLEFATVFNQDEYSISIHSVEYDDSGSPGTLNVEAEVEASYNGATRRILLSFEISLSYDIVSSHEIDGDEDGISIIEDLESECATTWKEININ